jgi:anti-sigma-K factor RsiG
MTEKGGHRRVDRIRDPGYATGLGDLPLEELREKRDECMAEREYLSLLRRLVQGRAEILKAELGARESGDETAPLVDRLATILSADEHTRGSARGEALRVGVPEEELLLARRRVERLVADAGLSDPTALDDDALGQAVEVMLAEERQVSQARSEVMRVLDALQEELKRRYKDDPTLALR